MEGGPPGLQSPEAGVWRILIRSEILQFEESYKLNHETTITGGGFLAPYNPDVRHFDVNLSGLTVGQSLDKLVMTFSGGVWSYDECEGGYNLSATQFEIAWKKTQPSR
jgi:hypothetical protein